MFDSVAVRLGCIAGGRTQRIGRCGNGAADQALDGSKVRHLFTIAERDGGAGCAGSAGAADAVDVGFRLVGQVVVDDVGNAVDVDAAAGNVGGDQNGNFVVGKIGQSALAGVLAFVAVDRLGPDAARVQMPDDAIGAVLGSGEDQRAIHR